MFARDLHLLLADASILAMVRAAAEGSWRFLRDRPPGRLSAGVSVTAIISVGMTAAGGLAMLVSGERPEEVLHLIYAVLALGLIPFGDSLAAHARPRRRAIARILGALVALLVIVRLSTRDRPKVDELV